MGYSKVLAIIATILLGVAAVCVALSAGVDKNVVEALALIGLTCFAAAHI
jgi:hypothetical protein